ncbi:XRE family transcriptional regulator [Planosporangium mesophilum]|uniref:XRE family transcriptional regulator n=1 Tax=Planosporangium mesophilum TaxID=689768 RepID=A0A8J3TBE0_9ACTN|nr:XRE family transcriptional regulator [Planosporangium mesophilum]
MLRAHRRAAGLTQQELAARAGVGVRTVRELERGRAVRPQRGTVDLLAEALGLTATARTRFIETARGRLHDPGAEAGRAEVAERFHRTIALPPPLPLVGRDEDLRDVAGLLAAYDVVLLIGLAGVGKSCLALAVAHHVAGLFPGGVAGISISDISAADDILAGTASVFGVARAAELGERCAGEPCLLMVDGADRAPGATTAALTWLRANAPRLRLLVTSRQPVDLPCVVAWPVAPLDVPPPGAASSLGELSAYPAVSLFLERLRQVRRHPVEPAEVPVLGELVRRLGGLPLAIELAAARGRVLELTEILDRYGHRVLDLGERRPEGQTLRDAVAASYRLLGHTDQLALERLAAFAGRWSLDLAEELLSGAVHDVEAVVDRLVGLGLVGVRATGPLRFRLLDVVHDFVLERCAKGGHLEEVRTRHARLFARLAARTADDLAGPAMPVAVLMLDHLLSDLNAALHHAAGADPSTGLLLAGSLTRWWRFRGRDREGRGWLRRLLDDPRNAGADPAVRAWAQLGAATLAIEHGEGLAELAGARQSLETFTRLNDVGGQIAAHTCLSRLWQAVGGYDDARRHADAGLFLATRTGRRRQVLTAHNDLTWHDIRVGDLDTARQRLETVERLAGEADDARLRAVALAKLAEVARLDGRYAAAVDIGRRALELLAEVGDPGQRVRVQGTVGLALAESGGAAEAEAIRAALADAGQAADGTRAMIGGYLALARGERAHAAKLFESAAGALLGHHDARDVVEALVGVAASTDDPAGREPLLAQLDEVCQRGGLVLLPRDRALLRR